MLTIEAGVRADARTPRLAAPRGISLRKSLRPIRKPSARVWRLPMSFLLLTINSTPVGRQPARLFPIPMITIDRTNSSIPRNQ